MATLDPSLMSKGLRAKEWQADMKLVSSLLHRLTQLAYLRVEPEDYGTD
jgi:hypothetical protein